MKQTRLLNYFEPRLKYNSGESLGMTKWRNKVLARDKNICQNCFNTIKDIFRKKTFSNEVHHIIAHTHGGRNTLANGITLCKFCHHYFGFMYFKHGWDYFQLTESKNVQQRINEVRKLLRKRYIRYLSNTIRFY